MVGPFNFDQDETNRKPEPQERWKGWDVVRLANGDRHVVASHDLEAHLVDGLMCPCEPFLDEEDEGLIIHNAFDGREIIEKLEAGEDVA